MLPRQLFFVQHAHIKRQVWPWSKGKSDWGSVREPLPANWQQHHMANGPHYGTYFVSGDRCHAAMIDIDDHEGSLGWPRVTEIAGDLLNALDEVGLIGLPFRSRGGAGINIWMIWDEPQQAAGARVAIRSALAKTEYREAAGFIEVFPKQDSVPEGELGNAACLPKSPLDPWTFEAGAIEWQCSDPVPAVDIEDIEFREVPLNRRTSATPEELAEVLQHIPNAGDKALDYDQWISVIAALKLTGGTYEQAQAWSAQSSKHDEDELKKKWRSFKRDGAGTVADFGTLLKLANIYGGYKGTPAVIEAFPDAPVVDLNGTVVEGAVDMTYQRVGGRGRYAKCIASTMAQLLRCMRSDPGFPWALTFDMFLADRLLHHRTSGTFELVQDHHITQIREWFERQGWEPIAKDLMRDVINLVARENESNVATQWAQALQWDGVDRFDHAITSMGIEVDAYTRAVVEYQWTAHAARVLDPGHQADSIIVLVSEEQGMRKSTLIKTLAPKIGDITTERDITIEQLLVDDRSARAMRGALVANMDEMRNFGKREAAEAKTALSRTHESYTPKYMETRTTFGRQCLIYATNNKFEFLDDETGNRRYYVLTVGRIDIDWYKANRDQLWAQGIAQFRASGVAWQEASRLAPERVKLHEVDDPWEPQVIQYLDIEERFNDGITVDRVLHNCLKMPLDVMDQRSKVRVAKIFKKLGYERFQKRIGDARVWAYRRGEATFKGSEALDW